MMNSKLLLEVRKDSSFREDVGDSSNCKAKRRLSGRRKSHPKAALRIGEKLSSYIEKIFTYS